MFWSVTALFVIYSFDKYIFYMIICYMYINKHKKYNNSKCICYIYLTNPPQTLPYHYYPTILTKIIIFINCNNKISTSK